MQKILFEETQSNKIIVAVIAPICVGFGILSLVQIGFHIPMGNHPAPSWLLVLIFILCIAGLRFFYAQKLKLIITEDDIRVSFGLLGGEQIIPINTIKNIYIRKYDALKEFWGWGVRYNTTTSCFTVSGNDALEIELMDGRKFLIGTQNVAALQMVIDNLRIPPR